MARGNKYTCRVCNKVYDYCGACEIVPNPVLENNFCCGEHYEIFDILSKHGCHLASAEETLEALDKYDLNDLSPEIMEHIESLYIEEADNNAVQE